MPFPSLSRPIVAAAVLGGRDVGIVLFDQLAFGDFLRAYRR